MKIQFEKYLRGESSQKDIKDLLEWVRRNNSNLNEFLDFKSIWESKNILDEMPESSKNSWNSLQKKILVLNQKKYGRTQIYLRTYKYAAMLLSFILITGITLYILGIDFKTPQNTIVQAEPGHVAKIILPDSTKVWLNSGSELVYNDKFGKRNRNVTLTGEAYFDVTKNKVLPFIVSGSPLEIKVLGTRFNVFAYPENKLFKVALEEGAVELNSVINENFKENLTPGHLATYNKRTNLVQIVEADVSLLTSWKEGLINIYNLPLNEIVTKLSNRYNQKIIVDEAVKNVKYTFTIKNETLPEILQLISMIGSVKVEQNGGTVILKPKN